MSATNDSGLAKARVHLVFGWWALLGFLTLGVVLETLHGFKVGWYLDTDNATRRHMWTLAHAHGTLLALINLALSSAIRHIGGAWEPRRRNLASSCLLAASILLPAGFFLGGVITHGGDPGLGILIVPAGAVFLIVAVFLAARACRGHSNA